MRELTVWLLSGIGLFASAHMARKAVRAARGELTGASVVQTPAARLLLGVPNAALGIVYYLAVAGAFPMAGGNVAVRCALTAAVASAGVVSCILAYDLVAHNRTCPYCWTAHAINALLLLATASLWTK